MNQNEAPVQLQTDQVSPGPSIRAITVSVPAVIGAGGQVVVNQQQVVMLADADGRIIDSFSDSKLLKNIEVHLREIRRLLSTAYGVPFFDPIDVASDTTGTLIA